MKRIYTILIICACLSLLHSEAKAQIIKGEAFLGLNMSQIDGDNAYGYDRYGIHGGLGVLVPVYKKGFFDIEFSMEVVYNQRGSHQRAIYIDNGNGITGEYDIYINYLEVPVLLYFSDKQIYSLGLGASYGKIMKLEEYEHGIKTDINIDYDGIDKYNLYDFCFLADAKIRLHERLKLGVRYQYSMDKIRTRPFYLATGDPDCPRDQYNNCLTFRLIYVINENRSEYIYDEYQFHGDNPKIHQKTINKELKKLQKKEAKKAGK